VLNDSDSKPDVEEALPSINEINLTGDQAFPELHLDVHVFAVNSAERFVFINMRKYREGATLPEGPTIERIRRDGVVLSYRGLRFLLPRQ
jgi:general secretion pathway protein B